MALNWIPAQIEIMLGVGGTETERKTVEAHSYGHLAVHRSAAGRRSWTVTHVPSGRAIVDTWSRRSACRVVEEITPLADWATVEPGAPPPGLRDWMIEAALGADGAMFVPCEAS